MISRLRLNLFTIRGPGSLGDRAIQSGVWITGGFVLQRALQFGSNLILTRLLFPEAFGTMALATVFLVGLAMFSDIGLKPAIIRDPRGDDPHFLNTAWTLQVIRGLGLFFVGCLLAYPVSLIYGQPILFPLLVVLSLTAAISGFQTIGLVTAERRLDFFLPTAVALAGQVVGILALVAIAYFWRSVWALAAGNVIGSLATLVIGHLIIRGHQHSFTFEKEAARSITNFGKWIFFSTIVTFLGGEGLRAIQAGFLTPADFGIVAIAYMIAGVPTDLMVRISNAIIPPTIIESVRNGQSFSDKIIKVRRILIFASILLVMLFIFSIEQLVTTIYDIRYHELSNIAKIIIISNWISLMFCSYSNVILAIGSAKSNFYSSLIYSSLRVSITLIGFSWFGLHGGLACLAIANFMHGMAILSISRSLGFCDFRFDILMISLVSPIIFFFVLNEVIF